MSVMRRRVSPSRRPPSASVAVIPPPPPKPKAAEQLQLSPVGMAIGATQSIGVFADQTTNEAVRLRVGEGRGDVKVWSALEAMNSAGAADRRMLVEGVTQRATRYRGARIAPSRHAVKPCE
jgi:hypothetical protein